MYVTAKTLEDAKAQTIEFYKGKKAKLEVRAEAETEVKTEVEAEAKTEVEIKAEAEAEAEAEEYDRMTVQSSYERLIYQNLSKAVRDRDDVYTSFVDFVSDNLEVYPILVGRVYSSSHGYHE
jgi:hypothetical protein